MESSLDTPLQQSVLQRLISTRPGILRFAARLTLCLAPSIKLGNSIVFSRWQDIQEILKRDLDFVIEPVNGKRITNVNGPFILGMDRNETLVHERTALYSALSLSDLPQLQQQVRQQADSLLDAARSNGRIDVVNGYARLVAARSAVTMLGMAGPSEADLMRVARTLFHECFLNLGDEASVRQRAEAAFKELSGWFAAEFVRRHSLDDPGQDLMGRMILAQRQQQPHALDNDGIRRTVSGMLVGAIDTTATCVAQITSVILNRPGMLAAVMPDLDHPDRMRGWCWEALRFWPHNPIILREAALDTEVNGTPIVKGNRIFCFTLAGMQDEAAFPYPRQANPTRDLHLYLHFGGGLHPCAGRAINGVQIPTLVACLLRRHPKIKSDIRFSGPFPNQLIVSLKD
jgi:cytochrome P450